MDNLLFWPLAAHNVREWLLEKYSEIAVEVLGKAFVTVIIFIVGKIMILLPGEHFHKFPIDRKASAAGIEYADDSHYSDSYRSYFCARVPVSWPSTSK